MSSAYSRTEGARTALVKCCALTGGGRAVPGPTGPMGPTGPAGFDGERGIDGPTGPTGAAPTVDGVSGEFLYLSGNAIKGAPNFRYVDASHIDVRASLTPDISGAYDLGTATNPFRDLYLSGTSLHLGRLTLTQDISSILVTLASGEQYYLAREPISAALANKILVSSGLFYDASSLALTWSATDTSNQFVPIGTDSSTLILTPTNPGSSGTGWRFSKVSTFIDISTGSVALINGRRYAIDVVGSPAINWTSIGAGSTSAGTSFIYNGAAITGGTTTPGKVVTSEKISWYSLNALYGLSLPTTLPTTNRTIKKCNLQTAWALIKMNADSALQGALALQIETYAYQNISGTNNYTGRWAYSYPKQQNLGFNAARTTNITTGAGLEVPRLRAGFTYLVYAADTTPSFSPNVTSFTYYPGGSGLFAPSQVNAANSLRDPYELYPQYPHFGFSSSTYSQFASQPAYGTIGPGVYYTDPGDVEVSAIYVNTDSASPSSAVGQTALDFNVMAFGYSGRCADGVNRSFTYTTSYV